MKKTLAILTILAFIGMGNSMADNMVNGNKKQVDKKTNSANAAPKLPAGVNSNDLNMVTILENVQYGMAGGVPLVMDITLPKPAPKTSTPVILLLHGGGWGGGERKSMLYWCVKMSKLGYVAATVEYRLASKTAPFPAQLQDCKCAVRFFRANAAKYKINPDMIGIMGCSAGGHLATMVGLTDGIAEFEGDGGWQNVSSRVQAVCDCFGPTDFNTWQEVTNLFGTDAKIRKLLGPEMTEQEMKWEANFSIKKDANIVLLFEGKAEERAKWASPITYVEKSINTPPFLIVQGANDAWVPMQQSILLANALDKKGVDVNLKIMLNGGHNPDKATKDIYEFFKRTLPLKK